nr:glycosyltransferase [Galbitalea soli]
MRDAPGVTVVVPVFNGGDVVERCLLSVVNHSRDARIVALDDASTDPATRAMLDRLAGEGVIELLRNPENLGYTRTVNRAIQISGRDDLVLLNSDTVVGPLWLQRLRWTAYSLNGVSAVSGFSNSAGALSLPERSRPNDWPEHVPWTDIARFMGQRADVFSLEAPTPHGFCMFLRREALDALGDFDEFSFPRGYGEENDWGMRAVEAGFVNLVTPRVFVRHEQGASFGADRARLIDVARGVLDELHPSFQALASEWVQSDEFQHIRSQSVVLRDEVAGARVVPRSLYVVHSSAGGTPETNNDLMQALEGVQDAFVLLVHEEVVAFYAVESGRYRALSDWRPERRFLLTDAWRSDYAAVVAQFLVDESIELVHVRHLVRQPLTTIPEVCRLLGIPMILSTHDFYYICPTIHLLDNHGTYCGGVCTPGEGVCDLPMHFLKGAPTLKHQWIEEWKRRSSSVLESAAHVIATTRSAASIYAANYPRHADRLITVEHGRDWGAGWSRLRAEGARRPGPLRVACPAMWSYPKGTEYLREIVELTGGRVEFHVLGNNSHFLADAAVDHGRYERSELRDVLAEIDPDFIGLFSVWPETYSHTLSEAWRLGVPVVATDLGAVADRITEFGGGRLFPVDDPGAAAEFLLAMADAQREGEGVSIEVPRHAVRSIVAMAEDYSQLYDSTRERIPKPVVGYLVASEPLPSRLQRRLHSPQLTGVHFRRVSGWDFADGLDKTDYRSIVVPPAALTTEILSAVLDRAAERGIPVILDAGAETRWAESTASVSLARRCVVVSSGSEQASTLATAGIDAVVIGDDIDPREWARFPSTSRRERAGKRRGARVVLLGSSVDPTEDQYLARVFDGLRSGDGERIILDRMVQDDAPETALWSRRRRWSAAILSAASTPVDFFAATAAGLPVVQLGGADTALATPPLGLSTDIDDARRLIVSLIDDSSRRHDMVTTARAALRDHSAAFGAASRSWGELVLSPRSAGS